MKQKDPEKGKTKEKELKKGKMKIKEPEKGEMEIIEEEIGGESKTEEISEPQKGCKETRKTIETKEVEEKIHLLENLE